MTDREEYEYTPLRSTSSPTGVPRSIWSHSSERRSARRPEWTFGGSAAAKLPAHKLTKRKTTTVHAPCEFAVTLPLRQRLAADGQRTKVEAVMSVNGSAHGSCSTRGSRIRLQAGAHAP
jgi:hypothetical protein